MGQMTIEHAATQIVRHHSDTARWEMVRRAPHPLLRRYVRDYVGYDEVTAAPLRRIEVPHDATVLILNFGPRLTIEGPRGSASHRPFFAGLPEAPVRPETAGAHSGVLIDLTPIGGFRLLRRTVGGMAKPGRWVRHHIVKGAGRRG